jgi:hypothetical protein
MAGDAELPRYIRIALVTHGSAVSWWHYGNLPEHFTSINKRADTVSVLKKLECFTLQWREFRNS